MKTGRRGFLQMSIGAAASTAVPVLGACAPCTYRTDHDWNNAVRIGGVDPEVITEPRSLEEIVALVKEAERDHAPVRMVGAGHSFSDVAHSEGRLFLPWSLNRRLPLDRRQLKAAHAEDKHLVRVESGMRLKELNGVLWKEGLALSVLGGYDMQTVLGATATGTHGSSLRYGAVGDVIVSYQLVTSGGAVVQVEPDDGITDGARFPSYIDTANGRVPATLVQDDDTFHALLVGLGCFGVVYSVVARVEPQFWLREVRTRTTWGAIKNGFLGRLLTHVHAHDVPYRPARLRPGAPEDPVYYEVYVNPYPPEPGASKDAHHCVLTERYKLLQKPARLTADDRVRGRFQTAIVDIMAGLTGKGSFLGEYMNNNPSRVPSIIDDALEVLKDRSYVGRGYDVFNLGPANEVRAYGIEMGFDLRQTIEATEALMDDARELARDGKRHSTPPSLRFAKRSNAHLAMMQGRETMMLEMGMIVCANGADDLLRHYEVAFMRDFGARPHWGLDLNVLDSYDQVRTLFPATADRWRAVYDRYNSSGTFNGALTDRLGISVPT